MADIYDVAEWFLHKSPMTHKKLQKLCYYAVAWSYALLDRNIAGDASFQAWVHGPVSPELFKKYTGNGWVTLQPEDSEHSFSDEEVDLLESVFLTYGKMSANELEVLSHNELPWKHARLNCAADERCTNEIDPQKMRDFYLSIYTGDDN